MSVSPIVQVKQGSLKGKQDTAKDGSKYFTFHNIPYAKPPLGHLRFKAPLEPEPWQGIRDATEEGDECFSRHQIDLTLTGSEDCLTLNVFSKSLNSNGKKPVMVFIHGGGFVTGSSKVEIYGPNYFMNEDIVFVTINYRLGIFGFLCLNDKSLGVPGNAGLKDQVLALRWVQDNIHVFGGDPQNVTIFGESAGAASVNCHLSSRMSKGLFHKAIMQSGSTVNNWSWGRNGIKLIAEYFDLKTLNEKEVLAFLQNVSKEDLLKAQFHNKDTNRICDTRPFGIVVEGLNLYEESFLADDPFLKIKSGDYNKVPIITGFNTHEGMLLDIIQSRLTNSLIIRNFEEAIPGNYNIDKGSAKSLQVAKKIKQFYYGNDEPSDDNKTPYYDLQTDTFFYRGIYVTLKALLSTNPHPVYFYRFSVDGDLNIFKKSANIAAPGVCHGDDIFYMFHTIFTPDLEENSVEDKTIKRFIKFWTNFARSGNPSPTVKSDGLIDKAWPRCDLRNLHCLDIGESLQIIDNPEKERMLFWDSIETNLPSKF